MRLPLVAVLVLAPLPAAAQHAHSAVAPAASAVLLPGMGSLHFPITTASPRAQKFFDQGMTLVYGFNHDEAARSFREAARLDPRAAMPHWGLALAIGPNYNDTAVSEERAKATWEAIEKAKSLAGGASEREQAFIGALEKRFSPDPKADWPKLWAGYSRSDGPALRALPRRSRRRHALRREPDDPEAVAALEPRRQARGRHREIGRRCSKQC